MNLAGLTPVLCEVWVLPYVVNFSFALQEVLSSYRRVELGPLFCDFGHMFVVCVQTYLCIDK